MRKDRVERWSAMGRDIGDFYLDVKAPSIRHCASEDAPETYEGLRYYLQKSGVIHVSNQNCGRSIYGSSEGNVAMRVVHDHLHCTHYLDFSFDHEMEVAKLQTDMVRRALSSKEYADLTWADTAGQVRYFEKWDRFPHNQAAFVMYAMEFGLDAAVKREGW